MKLFGSRSKVKLFFSNIIPSMERALAENIIVIGEENARTASSRDFSSTTAKMNDL